MAALVPPEPLARAHQLADFDCGEADLDNWLARFALSEQASEHSRTYVTHRRNMVVRGYFTIAVGGVAPGEATERVALGGAGTRPIGVAILARLAVDLTEQGNGVGASLLRDALIRVAQAADIIGIRAVLVHLKRPELRPFYERFDFELSPVDDLQMMLLMKDLRTALVAGSPP